MVAASNHVLYDNYLVQCKQQQAEIPSLQALLSVDKNSTKSISNTCDDDATLGSRPKGQTMKIDNDDDNRRR
jgi:hypothetical protein